MSTLRVDSIRGQTADGVAKYVVQVVRILRRRQGGRASCFALQRHGIRSQKIHVV